MRLSSTADVPAASASSSLRSRPAVKMGVSSSSPTTTPAWRAAIVQPPCTACAERPASARSVSAESASPRPAPIASCGGTVQMASARGSQPSAARPPAIRITPEAVRAHRGVIMCPRRAARIAASGITVTTRPAASGSRRQPLIRRITSRKKAATSAPEMSSSAAFAATCGRSIGRGSATARAPRSVSSAKSTTGACTRKIDSQPNSCVRTPPAAGPMAAPSTPARAQTRAAGASPPAASASRASAPQTTAAPAAPWAARAETSSPNDGAKPQTSDAAAKRTMPTPKTRIGLRRASKAAGRAASASARLYEVSAHASVATSTS